MRRARRGDLARKGPSTEAGRERRPTLASRLVLVAILAGSGLPGALRAAHAAPPPATIDDLGVESVERRRAAVQALSSPEGLGPDAVDGLARTLAAALQGGDDDRFAALLRGLRRTGPHDADLIAILVEQRPDPLVRRALTALCAIRALAHVGTTPAVRPIVAAGAAALGALRPEIFRELKQLDEKATAALIEAHASDPSPDQRAWAKDVLDALGKRTPGDAVQTTDDQVLVDILGAYGSSRDADALPVVLSFVHSERSEVRAAAREATVAYGKDAVPKIRTTYAALTGDRLADDVDPLEAAHKLFDAYDRLRLHDVYALLDQGLERQRAGDIDAALSAFDQVLARQPTLDQRAQMAPAYIAHASAVAPRDRRQALDDLRKALRLQDGPAADRTRSEMAYLDGEELAARGIPDRGPYEAALALDPENAGAQAALDRLDAAGRARRAREERAALATGAAGVTLVTLGVIVLLRRRRAALVD